MSRVSFIVNTDFLARLSTHGVLDAAFRPSTFRLGSGSGYTPSEAQPGLVGAVVYTGVVTTSTLDNGATDLLVSIPPEAGPFDYGEIGLYLDDDTLVAVYAYPTLNTKEQNSTSGVNATVSVHCLMKLAPGSATITITSSPTALVPLVNTWSAVSDPPTMNADVVIVSTGQGPIGSLKRSSATQWSPDDHVMIGTGLLVSSVGTSGADTVLAVTGVDTAVLSVLYRYIIQSSTGLVGRAKSVAANGLITMEGSVPWVSNGMTVSLWERTSARVEAHLLALDPHPQYLTQPEGVAQFTPVSHLSAANAHAQYLLKTEAATQYAPLSHTTAPDPHAQYLLESEAANGYLSRLVNTLITDSSGQARFRFNSASGVPGVTELFGAPDTGGVVFNVQEQSSNGSLRSLARAYTDGHLELPASAVSIDTLDSSLATTSWVANRLRTPIVHSMSSGTTGLTLDGFNEVVEYNYTGLSLVALVALVENAVYEASIVVTLPAGAGSTMFLGPNNQGYSGSFKTSSNFTTTGRSTTTGGTFYFDFQSPVGCTQYNLKLDIFNFRAGKTVNIQGSSALGALMGSSVWFGNPTIQWGSLGLLSFIWASQPAGSSVNWKVRLKRVV